MLKILMSVLILAIFVTALVLVTIRHDNRILFAKLQQLGDERDRMETEWGRLQLERSTLADPARIEQLAREQLGLIIPPPEAVVVIHVPHAER